MVCLSRTLRYRSKRRSWLVPLLPTDALSRNDDRTDEELTKILCSHCPSQVPEHFRIVPLPNKITLWLTLLLLWLPVKPGLVEEHTKTMLGCGTATLTIATASDSEDIISLMTSPDNREPNS